MDPRRAPEIAGTARPTLRLLTCGSVDDGKSTLIGRLLYEQGAILDDQFSALERDSKKHGTVGDDIDFALLVDGLEAEREQGITIDVAYRYFSTPRRAFVIADTPGHEQYTRNMATGASNADLAILLVDARKGLLPQTRRHAFIVSLLGIRDIVLAINKIDLVGYDPATVDAITQAFRDFAGPLALNSITAIPVSARFGDNLSSRSPHMPWYDGPTLLDFIETVDIARSPGGRPFRFPVQWVNRPNLDFRGYAGTIAAGHIRPGDEVLVAGSGRATTIARVIGPDGDLESAEAGDVATLTLTDDVDLARGDMLVDPKHRPTVADQFAAHVIWMGEEPLLPGRSYLLKLATRTLPATITALKHRIDMTSFEHLAAKTLALNEIGVCNLATSSPIAFDPFADCPGTGAFILLHRATNATVAAGLIDFPLRRASNIHAQALTVTKQQRAALKRQKPVVLWLTGLSGAGKSTIANLVEAELVERGYHTAMLDGDNVRHGLNKDLGFTAADRVENIRRVGEIAKLMVDAGLIVLCCFISPFRAERQMVRALVAEDEFIEVFVDAPIQLCIERDPKGLYRRAIAGEIRNFTGVDQEYEAPLTPEIRLRTGNLAASEAGKVLISALELRGVIADR